MSQENVEVVKNASEAWERGDLEAWLEALHPDVVWDSSRFAGLLEGSVYEGRDEVRAFLLDEWRASWDLYEAHVEDVVDAGDRVLVLWSQRMVEAGSGIPLEVHTAQLCSVRDGKVIRMDNFTDRAEARKAEGLAE